MNLGTAATVALIRRLTAARPKSRAGRIGRIPKPLPLDPIQREYFKAISFVAHAAQTAFEKVALDYIMGDLKEQRAAAGLDDKEHTDAEPDRKRWFPHALPGSKEWKRRSVALDARRALHLAAVAQETFRQSFDASHLNAIAAKFGERTNRHNRDQLDRQVRSALGIDYSKIERPVRSNVAKWTDENVKLIRTVPTRYFDRIRADVTDAYSSGMHPSTLAKRFVENYGSSLNDAKRIARDQIGKLNGDLNKARQQALGVPGYTWRGMRDNRERDNHADLEGVVCSWDEPPEGGGTDEDEPGHPGDGIQCRCYPEPDLSALIPAG